MEPIDLELTARMDPPLGCVQVYELLELVPDWIEIDDET